MRAFLRSFISCSFLFCFCFCFWCLILLNLPKRSVDWRGNLLCSIQWCWYLLYDYLQFHSKNSSWSFFVSLSACAWQTFNTHNTLLLTICSIACDAIHRQHGNPVKIFSCYSDFFHLIVNFKIYKINQLFIAHLRAFHFVFCCVRACVF